MRKLISTSLGIALGVSALAAAPTAAASDAVDCTTLPANTVEGRVQNLFVPADTTCTIAETGTVVGGVQVTDGTSTGYHVALNVYGTVNGNIVVVGPSNVFGPLVRIWDGATVNGNINVTGKGALDTIGRATINGNITSPDWQIGIYVSPGADIRGNLKGGDDPNGRAVYIQAEGTTIHGNIFLNGSGDAFLGGSASVAINGNIFCRGAGSDSNIPLASITGQKRDCPTQ